MSEEAEESLLLTYEEVNKERAGDRSSYSFKYNPYMKERINMVP
ncbi:hypothetical protein [Bacillus thuringiensis]|nr:hypothetical protein [Bacillus thuringiensis]